jgi:hypothetical protein
MPGSESPASSGTFVVQRADELWVEVEPLKALGKGSSAAGSSAAGSREAQQGDSGGDAPVAGTAGCRHHSEQRRRHRLDFAPELPFCRLTLNRHLCA